MPKPVTCGEYNDFVDNLDVLAAKYNVSERRVLEAISKQVSTFEELRRLDWKDLDAIVQEGLTELGR